MKADESGLSLSGVEFTPSPAARARAVARARGADAPPVSAAADLFGSITDISAADSSFDLEGQGRASLDAILGDEVPAAAPPVASAPILAPAPAPRVRDAELEANADPFAPPPGVRRALADAPAPARPGPSDSLRLDPGESALGFADAAPTREPTPSTSSGSRPASSTPSTTRGPSTSKPAARAPSCWNPSFRPRLRCPRRSTSTCLRCCQARASRRRRRRLRGSRVLATCRGARGQRRRRSRRVRCR